MLGLLSLENVEPLALARIGVVTKLDIMDRGTSAARILSNQHIPLQLGYIGVVNRCQVRASLLHEACTMSLCMPCVAAVITGLQAADPPMQTMLTICHHHITCNKGIWRVLQ
eukprot:1159792-Pelagomonas_calceolata.AAC.10